MIDVICDGCDLDSDVSPVDRPPILEGEDKISATEALEVCRTFLVEKPWDSIVYASMTYYFNKHPEIYKPAYRCTQTIEANKCPTYVRTADPSGSIKLMLRREAVAANIPCARFIETVDTKGRL